MWLFAAASAAAGAFVFARRKAVRLCGFMKAQRESLEHDGTAVEAGCR